MHRCSGAVFPTPFNEKIACLPCRCMNALYRYDVGLATYFVAEHLVRGPPLRHHIDSKLRIRHLYVPKLVDLLVSSEHVRRLGQSIKVGDTGS